MRKESDYEEYEIMERGLVHNTIPFHSDLIHSNHLNSPQNLNNIVGNVNMDHISRNIESTSKDQPIIPNLNSNLVTSMQPINISTKSMSIPIQMPPMSMSIPMHLHNPNHLMHQLQSYVPYPHYHSNNIPGLLNNGNVHHPQSHAHISTNIATNMNITVTGQSPRPINSGGMVVQLNNPNMNQMNKNSSHQHHDHHQMNHHHHQMSQLHQQMNHSADNSDQLKTELIFPDL